MGIDKVYQWISKDLDWLKELVDKFYKEPPKVFPQWNMSWIINEWEIVLNIILSDHITELHLKNLNTYEEKINILNLDEWYKIIEIILMEIE